MAFIFSTFEKGFKMNLSNEQNETLDLAMSTWGMDTQESMFIGELGELMTLFGRRSQGRDSEEEWIEELADVYITLSQLIRHHGKIGVQALVDSKLSKLRTKLDSINS